MNCACELMTISNGLIDMVEPVVGIIELIATIWNGGVPTDLSPVLQEHLSSLTRYLPKILGMVNGSCDPVRFGGIAHA